MNPLNNRCRERFVTVLMLVGLLIVDPVAGGDTKLQAESVDKSLSLGASFTPMGLALGPDSQFALVTNFGGTTTQEVNLSPFQMSADSYVTGVQPRDVAISADGQTAVVVNGLLNTTDRLFTIDLASGSVTAISGFQGPMNTNNRVVIDPASRFAYVSGGTGYRFDLTTNTLTEFSAVSGSTGLAMSANGKFLYAAKSGSISKIDLATGHETRSISLANVQEVAVSPSGDFILADSGSGIVKIDATTGEVLGTAMLERAASARWIAINPAGSFAYVVGTEAVLTKINLVAMSETSIPLERASSRVAISSDGLTAYVTSSGTISRVALVSADPQTINFAQPTPSLLGSKTVVLSATATSTLPITFASSTAEVCTVSGKTVTFKSLGDCTITASQAGGSGWAAATDVQRTFKVLPDPPVGEPGVSINDGGAATNSKKVTLSLVWPAFASEARISNDGGFAASKTQVVPLSEKVAWEIDDSVKGLYTKVVYVRFNGIGIDTTKTYQDDIILDTTAPTIQSSTAVISQAEVELSVKAVDDITGVSRIEVQGSSKVIALDFSTSIAVPLSDLGLTTSSVHAFAAKTMRFRVADGAANWTGWTTVALSGTNSSTSSSGAITSVGKSVTKATLARLVSPKSSKPTTVTGLRLVSGSAICRILRGAVVGKSVGQCRIQVTYKASGEAGRSRTVTISVRK